MGLTNLNDLLKQVYRTTEFTEPSEVLAELLLRSAPRRLWDRITLRRWRAERQVRRWEAFKRLVRRGQP